MVFFAVNLERGIMVTVMQKSTAFNNPAYAPERAIDGNHSTFAMTQECVRDPWWQIDFGQTVHIQNISIVNRNTSSHRIGK